MRCQNPLPPQPVHHQASFKHSITVLMDFRAIFPYAHLERENVNVQFAFDNLQVIQKQIDAVAFVPATVSRKLQFQKEFAEKVKSLNQTSSCLFKVPEIFEDFSGKKVLAMSYEPGLTYRQWLSQNPSRKDKDQVAVAILDLYFHEFFEWGLVQTDPNWGNFLIDKKNSDIRIGLLDFGASRRYSADFVKKYIALLDLASQSNPKAFRELAVDMGFIDPRESEAAFVAFEDMLKTAIKPFFTQTSGSTFFDFSDRNHTKDSQAVIKALSRELVYSPPPYSIVFLHRKLAGVYSILKSLDAKLDISPYWQMMNDLSKRHV
jgi:hypothetical protein